MFLLALESVYSKAGWVEQRVSLQGSKCWYHNYVRNQCSQALPLPVLVAAYISQPMTECWEHITFIVRGQKCSHAVKNLTFSRLSFMYQLRWVWRPGTKTDNRKLELKWEILFIFFFNWWIFNHYLLKIWNRFFSRRMNTWRDITTDITFGRNKVYHWPLNFFLNNTLKNWCKLQYWKGTNILDLFIFFNVC